MPIKKVMLVLGLVCVVAPALASAAFMARQGGYSGGQWPDGALTQLIASLQEFIDRRDAEVDFEDDGFGSGTVRLPFRANANGDIDLRGVFWAFDPEAADAAFDDGSTDLAFGMIPGSSGPVGAQDDGASEQGGARGDGATASNGGVDGAGGVGGGSGIGGGGGANGGGSGSDATELALLVDPNDGAAEIGGDANESLYVMPLPASVWMLLASMVGLGVIGYQRRRRPF